MGHDTLRSPRRLSLSIALGAALALLLAAAAGAQAQCPKGTFFLDLTTGQTFPANPPARITLTSLAPTPNPNCSAGWYAARLKLDLAPPCDEAEIVVEYDKPIGFTLNIGDSPTNDAYGGDASTTPNNAEMWINQQIMWLASNRAPGGNDNNLYQENLALNYGAWKFTVKNQWFSWGNPYHVLQTVGSKKLFTLPDTAVPSDGYNVYVGLNRIVGDYPSRSGCGLQRAMVTVE